MNSTQHSMRRSRASLLNVTPAEGGRISETIFWTVALGRERSSLPVRGKRSVICRGEEDMLVVLGGRKEGMRC